MKRVSTNQKISLYSICVFFVLLHGVIDGKCQNIAQHMVNAYNEAQDLMQKVEEKLRLIRLFENNRSSTTNTNKKLPTSCLTPDFETQHGVIRRVQVPGLLPFFVACDNCLAGFGWLVIQRRMNGSVNFYRNWAEYKKGFGSLDGEFFIGLEKLRAITALEPFELYIVLEDFNKTTRSARFDEFAIGHENDDYALNVLGTYFGNAGDSLRSHQKMKFSTYDRDNDNDFRRNCAMQHVGAWWYNQCVDSNLNGQYIQGGHYEEKLFARGMCWRAWRGHNYGYKFIQMMIRPRCRHFPAYLKNNNCTRQQCEGNPSSNSNRSHL